MTQNDSPFSLADLWRYLRRYGYLGPVPSDQSRAVSESPPSRLRVEDMMPAIRAAVERLLGQEAVSKLDRAGGLREATEKLLATPRCAVPDVALEAGSECAWPHFDVRFWQDVRINGFTQLQVKQCWEAAVASWAEVCGITPAHVASRVQANVWAQAAPIDGPGSVLAWSQLPCGSSATSQVEQRYDARDSWTQYGLTYLQEVMAHEIGHAIGIGHLANGNLMQPYATGKIVKPQSGDIAEARKRYGPPRQVPQPQPTKDYIEIITPSGERYRIEAVRI